MSELDDVRDKLFCDFTLKLLRLLNSLRTLRLRGESSG
jgi:hypothetical protein